MPKVLESSARRLRDLHVPYEVAERRFWIKLDRRKNYLIEDGVIGHIRSSPDGKIMWVVHDGKTWLAREGNT